MPKASSLFNFGLSNFGNMTNEEFIKCISLEGEEWRDVVGYEETYMVSSFGRAMSKHRIVRNRYSTKEVQPRLLSPHTTKRKGNYKILEVKLWKGSVGKTALLHRLVATAFIPNPLNYREIDHIDTNTSNNRIENLRWCSRLQNANNPKTRKNNSIAKQGLINTKKSIQVVQLLNGNPNCIFSSMSEAERNGFSHAKISLCCSGKRNSHKGFQWMYLSDYEASINKSKNT